jgi:hypothetical protein
MIPRRHDFRPPSRSDDEATSIEWSLRRSDAEGGRKARRPEGVGQKRPIVESLRFGIASKVIS